MALQESEAVFNDSNGIKWHQVGQFFHDFCSQRCSTDVPEKVAAEACPETLQAAESVPYSYIHIATHFETEGANGPVLRT